jgi:hypothetical protein
VDELPSAPRVVHEARDVVADVHHGLRQEKAKGDADALAHIHACAKDTGAAPAELAKISGGFTRIAEDLLDGGSRRRRANWRTWRHREPARKRGRPELPPGWSPPGLPPGPGS